MPPFGRAKKTWNSSRGLLCVGASEASFLEIPTLACTCVVATFFWLLLTLFIRKLRQVGRNASVIYQTSLSVLLHCQPVWFLSPKSSDSKPEYLSIIVDTGEGPIENQCERLQYDPSQWEFPRERLKLGTRLRQAGRNLWASGDACASLARSQQILGFSHRSYRAIIGSDSHSVNQTLCLRVGPNQAPGAVCDLC